MLTRCRQIVESVRIAHRSSELIGRLARGRGARGTPVELRAWRKQAGLSQTELGLLLEVSIMTISRWERGECAIPRYLWFALAYLSRQGIGSV